MKNIIIDKEFKSYDGMPLVDMRPLAVAIDKISADIHSEMPRIIEHGDGPELKTALRFYIDRLEELLNNIRPPHINDYSFLQSGRV